MLMLHRHGEAAATDVNCLRQHGAGCRQQPLIDSHRSYTDRVIDETEEISFAISLRSLFDTLLQVYSAPGKRQHAEFPQCSCQLQWKPRRKHEA